ncbi:hypothetical protein LTR36_003805 [Oleoguttula mirabilis]|uniref:S-adenosyl-L-methionine-dependent methyltransferase n=1 Tax=Oleoguttula mirabilis TaxID=1507867 RepID=A0AAV9JID8_9PEZI|nr:hypothetical protein LTR36_003805 [Oleoguttula mirabilis]
MRRHCGRYRYYLRPTSQSDNVTLASTILRHREEWGRTYHKFRGGTNDYWGPNDDQQNNQLDLGHHMMTMLLGDRLYLAPIDEKGQKCSQVLDVGCGTGIWAIDFADQHPEAQVTGLDLSAIQPEWVPPNCHFAVDDVEDEWTYPADHFDFVHIRCLMGSISDWKALYSQAYDRIAPGGWLQHMDMAIDFMSDDGSIGPDHMLQQWSQTFIEAGEKLGKTFKITDRAEQLVRETGFVDVHKKVYKLPVGTWTKDKPFNACQALKQIGLFNYVYCLEGCEGWALYLLTRVMGWPIEQVQVFIAKFRNALNDRKNHAYYMVSLRTQKRALYAAGRSAGFTQKIQAIEANVDNGTAHNHDYEADYYDHIAE